MRQLAGKLVLLGAAGLMLVQSGIARAVENDVGAWLIVVATDRLPGRDGASDSRWMYWLEAQARYPDAGSGVNQLLLRPALGYALGPSVSAFAGYARFRTHGRSGSTSTEDRLWQHLSWRFLAWEDVSLTMRFRLEQRSLSGSNDTGQIFRYQLAYSRRIEAGGARLFASLEPFFDLRDTDYGARSGLSQVRLNVGASFPLSARNSLSIGYQNQYLRRPSRENLANHLAMLSFRTRF